MVWIDILILLLLFWFSFKGFKNGFIVELSTLIGLFLAIWGAFKYRNFIGRILHNNLGLENEYLPIISFIVAFIIIIIFINLIGKILSSIINIAHLGFLNRLLGFLFGLIKISVILSLLINGFYKINLNRKFVDQNTIEKSYLFQPLNSFASEIYEFYDNHYDEIIDSLDKATDDIDTTTI